MFLTGQASNAMGNSFYSYATNDRRLMWIYLGKWFEFMYDQKHNGIISSQ